MGMKAMEEQTEAVGGVHGLIMDTSWAGLDVGVAWGRAANQHNTQAEISSRAARPLR